MDETTLLCARCCVELTPGKGDFFEVRIEALADPTPPVISDEDLMRDHKSQIAKLIDQMEDLSERELLDQVHRRLVLHLCRPCYRKWIEDPVG